MDKELKNELPETRKGITRRTKDAYYFNLLHFFNSSISWKNCSANEFYKIEKFFKCPMLGQQDGSTGKGTYGQG